MFITQIFLRGGEYTTQKTELYQLSYEVFRYGDDKHLSLITVTI